MTPDEFSAEMKEWRKYCFDGFNNNCYDDCMVKMTGYLFETMELCLAQTDYRDGVKILQEIQARFDKEA